MSRKRKKWFGYGGDEDEYYDDLFSNTRKQHQDRLKKVQSEEPETDYLSEESYSYDYGFNTSFKKKNYDFDRDWEHYKTTGVTYSYNYYKPANLTYKYVQQMANTIASEGGIKAQIGNDWKVDIKNKILTYNPTSLMYGTKGELLATLLHETGKIAHSTDVSDLKSKYLGDNKMHVGAKTVLSIFEGTRIDIVMLKSYPSASEVYESNTEVVKKIVIEYRKNATELRQAMKYTAGAFVKQIHNSILEQMRQRGIVDLQAHDAFTKIMLGDVTQNTIGKRIEEPHELMQHVEEFSKKQATEPLLEEYVSEMMRLSYGIDIEPIESVKDYVDKTYKFVAPASKMRSTQEVVNMLDKDVYPIIEPLLKQQHEGTESQKEAFGENAARNLNKQARQLLKHFGGQNEHQLVDEQGKELPRMSSGRSDSSDLPMEWANGDYNSLRESVDYEIKQLTNRLNFIKREESVERFTSNERRGKLDTKKLYRFATGNTRLFKRKLPNVDTVRSFAFTLMVDISGSMAGNRVIHATRGLIILAEVFEKFDIPYEIIVFQGYPKTLKKFDQKLDKDMKSKIGHIVNMTGGGTNLIPALETVQVQKQQESNKIVVVLSDGDTESHKQLDNDFFIPWEKKGIKSIGIGIETGKMIETLCHGNGIAVDQSTELPNHFASLLKKLIKKRS